MRPVMLAMNSAWKWIYGAAVVAAAVLAALFVLEQNQTVSLLFWTLLAALPLGRASGQLRFRLKHDV
jgi:hypothetical protein